jgi:hypothetical protein
MRERDTHMWVFAHNPTPEVECAVRKWLPQQLNAFYCELQVMYTPLSTSSMDLGDETVEVNARGLSSRDDVKTLIKATGLNPHLSVCGWPFCLDDVDTTEGGAM